MQQDIVDYYTQMFYYRSQYQGMNYSINHSLTHGMSITRKLWWTFEFKSFVAHRNVMAWSYDWNFKISRHTQSSVANRMAWNFNIMKVTSKFWNIASSWTWNFCCRSHGMKASYHEIAYYRRQLYFVVLLQIAWARCLNIMKLLANLQNAANN